jgi:predicted secreted protein
MSYTGSQAFAGQGTQLQRGDGASPENFTTIAEITKIQRSGSKMDLVDVTNMDSIGAYREKLATLLDGGQVSFDANYVPAAASQQSLQADFDGRVLSSWKIILPGGRGTFSFKAYSTSADFDVSVDKASTFSGKLEITGQPSFA